MIVSTELDEIFALSDRIAVMYDGRIVGTVTPDIAREDIGLMMAGAHGPAEVAEARHEHRTEDPGPPPSHPRRRSPAAEPQAGEQKPVRRPIAPADWLPTVKTTMAAIVLALLIGAVLIAFSSRDVLETLPYFFSYPWDFFSEAADAIGDVLLGADHRRRWGRPTRSPPRWCARRR